jgi:hypothetical protein
MDYGVKELDTSAIYGKSLGADCDVAHGTQANRYRGGAAPQDQAAVFEESR